VSSDIEPVLRFIEDELSRQATRFPTVTAPKVLSFMGTTSRPGSHARVSIHRVYGAEPGGSDRELEMRLAGPLTERPQPGQCLTVHVTRLEQYQGYQLKTRALAPGDESQLFVEEGGQVRVKGYQLFTVHHSPYTLKFFERVPFEEVRDLLAGVRYALCAVGETANLSPRFVFHHEVKDGRLCLFHGDGLALKTYMNLKLNRQETRVLVDLDEFRGFALKGTVEEFSAKDHPLAHEKVRAGFLSGGWGRPSRTFRFVAETVEPIGPSPGSLA
jgi:hypothetical protein